MVWVVWGPLSRRKEGERQSVNLPSVPPFFEKKEKERNRKSQQRENWGGGRGKKEKVQFLSFCATGFQDRTLVSATTTTTTTTKGSFLQEEKGGEGAGEGASNEALVMSRTWEQKRRKRKRSVANNFFFFLFPESEYLPTYCCAMVWENPNCPISCCSRIHKFSGGRGGWRRSLNHRLSRGRARPCSQFNRWAVLVRHEEIQDLILSHPSPALLFRFQTAAPRRARFRRHPDVVPPQQAGKGRLDGQVGHALADAVGRPRAEGAECLASPRHVLGGDAVMGGDDPPLGTEGPRVPVVGLVVVERVGGDSDHRTGGDDVDAVVMVGVGAIVDGKATWKHQPRQAAGHRGGDPQGFFDAGVQVWQGGDLGVADVGEVGEGAPDLACQPGQGGRVAQQVEEAGGDGEGDAVAAGPEDKGNVGLELPLRKLSACVRISGPKDVIQRVFAW